MKIFHIHVILIFICFSFDSHAGIFRLNKDDLMTRDIISRISPFYDDNERCLKCHGQERYEYTNENLGRQVNALMCTQRIIRRDDFYKSNHKSFSCTDCHSDQYINFPHQGELRMEQSFNCTDCHGGDEMFARFNFKEIEADYQQSTHYRLQDEGFSCWKCHNPHSYKLNIRNSENLKETILYDNTICLSCHSNFNRFQLLTDHEEINIIQKHDWLPNQTAHFKSVRCIECHTKTNDSTLVAHLIRPKEEAIRGCNECHSKNSILLSSLYKFKSKEQRRNNGFVNGIMLNESYVIGANRNEYLNLMSLVVFIIIICAIGIHIVFRIKKK